MPGGKIEMLVDGGDFEAWLAGLEAAIRSAMS
jgi:hypothetical protein